MGFSHLRGALCMGLGVLTCSPSAPSPADVERPITLSEVVTAALTGSPDVQVEEQRLESARAAVAVQAESFVLRLASEGSVERSDLWNAGGEAVPWSDRIVARQLQWTTSLLRTTRFGPTFGLGLQMAQSRATGSPTLSTSTPSLSVNVPLMRGAWGASATRAAERAARVTWEAQTLSLRHRQSEAAFAAAIAYWDYLSGWKRLEAARSSESRAERVYTDTQVLVRADERASVDLKQAEGHLASRRTARILAEQSVAEAWHALLLAMGRAPEDLGGAELPPPAATDFPSVVVEPPPAQGLIELALTRRLDLAAAGEAERSTSILVGGARNELRPRLDLELRAGYTGQHYGGLWNALYSNVPGPDLSAAVRLQLPLPNSGPEGRLGQYLAAKQEQTIAREDLARRIRSGVWLTVEALRRTARAVAESHRAVSLLRASVDGEKRKFQLGASTIFAVIQAEDLLDNAILAEIESRRTHSAALAAVRFETGTLLPDGSTSLSAELLTVPEVTLGERTPREQ